MWFQSIRIVILLGIFCALLISLGGTAIYTYHINKNSLYKEFEESRETLTNSLAKGIIEPVYSFSPDNASRVMQIIKTDTRISRIYVYDVFNEMDFFEITIPSRRSEQSYVNEADLIYKGELIGTLTLEFNDRKLQEELSTSRTLFSFMFLLAILANTLIMLPLIYKKILRPLSRLSASAKELKEGQLERILNWQGNDEISLVGRSLEQAKTSISSLLEETQKSNVQLRASKDQISTLIDNVDEGFLIFKSDLSIEAEHSKACDAIFGYEIKGQNIANVLYPKDLPQCQKHRQTFADNISMLCHTDDEFTFKMLLGLLPRQFTLNNKILAGNYKVLSNQTFMMVLQDITSKIELENKVRRGQDKLVKVVKAVTEKNDFLQLVRDFERYLSEELPEATGTGVNVANLKKTYRKLHTFKGLFAFYSLNELSEKLHEAESLLAIVLESESPVQASSELLTELQQLNIRHSLDNEKQQLIEYLGEAFFDSENLREVPESDLQKLQLLLDKGDTGGASDLLRQTYWISVKKHISAFSEMLVNMAPKLDKELQPLVLTGDDIKLDPAVFGHLLDSLVHLFRNSLDHGIEIVDERIGLDKPEAGLITCQLSHDDKALKIIVADDGKGIDVASIKQRALEKQLITVGEFSQLSERVAMQLIFHERLSSKEGVSMLSGRGVGLSVVKTELDKLRGTIEVDSTMGRGTRFLLTVPLNA